MSDHFSGPAVMGDPSVDITDFYAFPSPLKSDEFSFVFLRRLRFGDGRRPIAL
jgi:hypothetical protein